ncbi:MAG: diguanylate cyclase [Rhizobiaceae bacterium]|nr:diguanylate cyclase [Rhizobiaceae bacterium]
MTYAELASGFLQNFGIVAVVAFAYSAALSSKMDALRTRAVIAAMFGIGTAATMWIPITLSPGLLFDMRHGFIVLSALFGGWPALAVTTVVGLIMRAWQGGAGATAGMIGIVISAGVGLGALYILRGRSISLGKLALMGCLASISLVSIFVLPWSTVVFIAENILGPTILANFVCVFLTGHILDVQRARHESHTRLAVEATVDPLTGLANRRSFDKKGPRLVDRAAAAGQSYAMMIIDIDHFKSVNDRYGHDVGDLALQHVAKIVSSNVRHGDIAARYGGEEIVLLLFDYDRNETLRIAERIRNAIARDPVMIDGTDIELTVSVGIHVPSVKEPFLRAFQRADGALYQAKRNGRDRVEFAEAA